MEYVMSHIEKEIYDLIEKEGCEESLASHIRALVEYAHAMSDMGLKEKSIKAMEVAEMLKDIRAALDE